MQINVFIFRQTERPQEAPLKTAKATLVDLLNNERVEPRLRKGETLFFRRLSGGYYNAVVSANGYYSVSKQIQLDCRFADEKNIYHENVFLRSGDFTKTETIPFNNIDYRLMPEPIPAPGQREVKSENDSFQQFSIANLNERAVFLPKPIFPANLVEQRFSSAVPIYVKLFLKIDKHGKVTQAKATGGERLFYQHAVEAIAKAEFTPLMFQGDVVEYNGKLSFYF